MRQAFAPVYSELERDAATAELIRRIDSIKKATTVEPPLEIPADCTGTAPPTETGSTDGTSPADASALNGIYRWDLTEDEIKAVDGVDSVEAALNAGVETWTFKDGTVTYDLKGPDATEHLDGTYTIDGDQLDIELPGQLPIVLEVAASRRRVDQDDDGTRHRSAHRRRGDHETVAEDRLIRFHHAGSSPSGSSATTRVRRPIG